jgi:hypothetical protein
MRQCRPADANRKSALVKMPLKTKKHLPDLLGIPKILDSIPNGVVVAEPEKG